ncbi:MAG: hypothetical protein NC548_26080 [Lachnospiraceae bacterium]|nr:hypothetical protein [Lachnospiraceae bacterium]
MKLGIFFLATSVYKEYFDEFSKSLHNLFPDNNVEKHLVIMSDGLSEYNNTEQFGCKIHWVDVIDLPYPLVPCNKFQMVAKYMKDFELDYGMFFDADSIILEKSHEFWESLKTKLQTGKLLCSGHPHYLFVPDMDMHEPLCVSRTDSAGYVDANYVNIYRSYIITSFFAGSADAISKYARKIYHMIGYDLKHLRWLPEFVDEAYMNAIYVNEIIKGKRNDIIKEKYITINPYIYLNFPERNTGDIHENNFPEIDTIFINQKYNVGLKSAKKLNEI